MKNKTLIILIVIINLIISVWSASYLIDNTEKVTSRAGECIGYGIILSACIYNLNKIVLFIIERRNKQ